jgi:hypothetical protein
VIVPGSGLFSAGSCPPSIVGAEAFHFRVRDGNGWFHLALATRNRSSQVDAQRLRAATLGSRPVTLFILVAGEGFEPPTFGL